jgi:hypothetical protein
MICPSLEKVIVVIKPLWPRSLQGRAMPRCASQTQIVLFVKLQAARKPSDDSATNVIP